MSHPNPFPAGEFLSLLRSLLDYFEIRKIDGHYIAVEIIIAGVKKLRVGAFAPEHSTVRQEKK